VPRKESEVLFEMSIDIAYGHFKEISRLRSLVQQMIATVKKFTGEAVQGEDQTIVVVRVEE